jgi:hypothetical protein
MRGPSLFFITIVMATPRGRAALEAYSSETVTRFTVQSPYSYLTLISMAAIALVLLMMMRQRRTEMRTMVCIVRREIRGPVAVRQRTNARTIGRGANPQQGSILRRMFTFWQRFLLLAAPVTGR